MLEDVVVASVELTGGGDNFFVIDAVLDEVSSISTSSDSPSLSLPTSVLPFAVAMPFQLALTLFAICCSSGSSRSSPLVSAVSVEGLSPRGSIFVGGRDLLLPYNI